MFFVQEEAKALKKRNQKALKDILTNMSKVTYKTTWQEAQQLLLDNVDFTNDTELQSKMKIFFSNENKKKLFRFRRYGQRRCIDHF